MKQNDKQQADETKKMYATNQASEYVKNLMNAKTNQPTGTSVNNEVKPDVEIELTAEKDTHLGTPNNRTPKQRKSPSVNQTNYKEVFMTESSLKDRRSVYVSKELHLKLSNYLSVIAGKGFSIGVYIDNILNHHLTYYKRELDELYRTEVNKLLNQ